jgi:hypothetical protein
MIPILGCEIGRLLPKRNTMYHSKDNIQLSSCRLSATVRFKLKVTHKWSYNVSMQLWQERIFYSHISVSCHKQHLSHTQLSILFFSFFSSPHSEKHRLITEPTSSASLDSHKPNAHSANSNTTPPLYQVQSPHHHEAAHPRS